jgi:hypothetical protein
MGIDHGAECTDWQKSTIDQNNNQVENGKGHSGYQHGKYSSGEFKRRCHPYDETGSVLICKEEDQIRDRKVSQGGEKSESNHPFNAIGQIPKGLKRFSHFHGAFVVNGSD